MRVLCNTPTPQGSVGITTNLQPAMTLGCGAVAGNITGDNIGPKHLLNIKRLAYAVRRPEEAFEYIAEKPSGKTMEKVDKQAIMQAVDRYLAQRGLAPDPAPSLAATVVDRFLSGRKQTAPSPAPGCAIPVPPPARTQAAPVAPAEPAVTIVDFVSEYDVRVAIQKSQKIYIGPKTIVTPSARDMASAHDTLVLAKRS